MAEFLTGDYFVTFFNGLIIALGIYLIASGLSLVFGVLGALNFAHGPLYSSGAFLGFPVMRYVLPVLPGAFGIAWIVVPFPVAPTVMGMEITFLRPITVP